MTEIRCDRERCKYNDDGECASPVIVIDEEGNCLDFEKFRG